MVERERGAGVGAKVVVVIAEARATGTKATSVEWVLEEEDTEAVPAAAVGVELESRDGTMPIGTMPLHSTPPSAQVPLTWSRCFSSWRCTHVQCWPDLAAGGGATRAGKHGTIINRGRFEESDTRGGPIDGGPKRGTNLFSLWRLKQSALQPLSSFHSLMTATARLCLPFRLHPKHLRFMS